MEQHGVNKHLTCIHPQADGLKIERNFPPSKIDFYIEKLSTYHVPSFLYGIFLLYVCIRRD